MVSFIAFSYLKSVFQGLFPKTTALQKPHYLLKLNVIKEKSEPADFSF
jgi:hypothetical protein